MSEGPPAFSIPGQAGRDLTIARFYMRPVENSFRTKQEGRPIFDEVEYVEIFVPGHKSVVDERVKDEHRQRWPERYKAFKEGLEVPETGTPLLEWPGVTRSMAEELAYFHVRTVEQLAGLDDIGLQKAVPMGGHSLRDKARRYLAQAAQEAPNDALAAENAQLRETIELMKQQMQQQSEEIERLRAASRGPGA